MKRQLHGTILPFSVKGRDLNKVRITVGLYGFVSFETLDETPDHPMARAGYDIWLYEGSEFLMKPA